MRTLFAALAFNFYDDALLVGLSCERDSAQRVYHDLQRFMGTRLDPRKRQPMAPQFVYTGMKVDFTDLFEAGEIEVAPKNGRVEALEDETAQNRARDRCTPKDSASIRGKAGFLGMQLTGRVAMGVRVASHPEGAPQTRNGEHIEGTGIGPRLDVPRVRAGQCATHESDVWPEAGRPHTPVHGCSVGATLPMWYRLRPQLAKAGQASRRSSSVPFLQCWSKSSNACSRSVRPRPSVAARPIQRAGGVRQGRLALVCGQPVRPCQLDQWRLFGGRHGCDLQRLPDPARPQGL